ncbi:hypothetical protein SCHPADRAFT_601166 [Schizopora paradoxa]|uniref:DUF6533 domain-containing protein n=1 Tax=Schizopora paradoxa TaxID=27342 RepID=A0A0H2RA05_9AGAM|nr:hypothetical protein SCHPADRAFT_601166 [Schizopora paradoxa]
MGASLDGVFLSVNSSKYYQLASIVMLFYDFILTLDVEIEEIWGATLRPAVVLFLINRYLPLAAYSWIVAAYHQNSWSESHATNRCRTFLHFPTVAVVLSECVMSAIVIYRIRALYSGMNLIMCGISFLALVQCLSGAVASANVTLFEPEVVQGCFVVVKQNKQMWFAMCGVGPQTPLLDLFFRDGSVYFAVMSIAKIVNFVVFWTTSRNFILVNWTFNHTITVVMISRIFLNLRSFNNEYASPHNYPPSIASIAFATESTLPT